MAKITTITNPLTGQPAQVDQLDHTAQEIDDAIARALPGGDIDIALQNKAPAGYGLGTYGRPLGANDDLNNITKNGWYYWSSNLPANAITPWSAMFVNVLNDGHIVQTIYPFSMPGTRIIRVCTGSIWKPDEYENPPMQLGGMDENGNPINEYRTTERWLGYPVYVKTINFGAMTDGKSVEVVKNPRHVVRCSAVIDEGNGTLPDIAPQALSQSSCFTSGITQNADGERVAVAISKIGTSLGTSVTATVTVWYTKLTD